MDQQQIKNIETELWSAADSLREGSSLTAAEYKDPLLGLVFLRFIQNKFEDVKSDLSVSGDINPRTGKPFEPTADDFASKGAIMLDEKAKYDYLVDLPEGEDIADATNNAMRLIEEAYPESEIKTKKDKVYQHIYSSYFGSGRSVYKQTA